MSTIKNNSTATTFKTLNFTRAKLPLTQAVADEFWQSILDRHVHTSGDFAEKGADTFFEDVQLYRAFREKHYHTVTYKVTKDELLHTLADQPNLNQPSQHAVSIQCNYLAKHFPVGRYLEDLSIVDEACVFRDCQGQEIACYDRFARSSVVTAEWNQIMHAILLGDEKAKDDSNDLPKNKSEMLSSLDPIESQPLPSRKRISWADYSCDPHQLRISRETLEPAVIRA